MSLVQHTLDGRPYPHPTTCSGCFGCNPELAATMRMNAAEHVAWLRRRTELHPHYRRYAAADKYADPAPTLESIFVRSGPPAPSVSEVLVPGYADAPPSLADVIADQIKKGVRES